MRITPVFILIALLVAGLTLSAAAQPPRRKPAAKPAGKAAQKTADENTADSAGQQADPDKAAKLFDEGQAAHEAGKLDDAIRLYTDALAADPELWQAEYQRAQASFALDRFAAAREGASRVLELLAEPLKAEPDSAQLREIALRVQTTLGEILLAEHNAAAAETAFRKSLEYRTDAPRARAGLAQVFFTGAKYEAAIGEIRAALAAGDQRASSYALLGAALAALKKYDEALAALSEALKREPDNAAALRYRADLYLARGDETRAIADLQAALKISGKDTGAMLRLAELQARSRPEEALRLARQVIALDPANGLARNLLASLEMERDLDSGEAKQVMAKLDAMVQAEPARADLRAQLADKLLATAPDKALEQYAKAAELEPRQLKHRIGMAASMLRLRRFPEAAGVARAVLAQSPTPEVEYFAHTNLATALFEQDDYPGAANEYLWILNHQNAATAGTEQQAKRRAAVTLFFLGICLDRLGDFEQALKAYEQFLSIAPPENQLEIDKVKLRLDPLRRQIEKSGKRKRK
ncbi:MAG: tetratricopeptide repeat protein [Blastocatellia bacterium]